MAKGACKNTFIMMMLDEVMLNPKEERLIGRIHEDNMGAIYLVKNQHIGAEQNTLMYELTSYANLRTMTI